VSPRTIVYPPRPSVSERSIIVEVFKRGSFDWRAEWRPEDDPQWKYLDERVREAWVEFDFFGVTSMTEGMALRRARRTLQRNADSAAATVRKQLLEDKTFRRVAVIIDVTKLKEAEADAASAE
jgi:hypothetical protein